jgi:hypothetical protein
VTPDGVDGYRDQQRVGKVPAPELTNFFTEQLNEVLTWYPEDPYFMAAESTFTPRGGMGLFLDRGSASFRSAVLVPRTDEP